MIRDNDDNLDPDDLDLNHDPDAATATAAGINDPVEGGPYPRISKSLHPRSKSKITIRDLGHRGVKETTHTSFRLDPEDRILLRKLAEKQRRETGMDNLTMSSVLRRLIRAAAKEAGIK